MNAIALVRSNICTCKKRRSADIVRQTDNGWSKRLSYRHKLVHQFTYTSLLPLARGLLMDLMVF